MAEAVSAVEMVVSDVVAAVEMAVSDVVVAVVVVVAADFVDFVAVDFECDDFHRVQNLLVALKIAV